MSNTLPFELTTERMANRALGESEAAVAWISNLTADDQNRFFQVVHHVAYTVFTEAIYRTGRVPIDTERAEDVLKAHGIEDETTHAIVHELTRIEGDQ